MTWIFRHRALSILVSGEGVTAFEAKAYVGKLWAVDPQDVSVENVAGVVPVDVELRFEGDDYSAGGTPKGRRLMEREHGGVWREA